MTVRRHDLPWSNQEWLSETPVNEALIPVTPTEWCWQKFSSSTGGWVMARVTIPLTQLSIQIESQIVDGPCTSAQGRVRTKRGCSDQQQFQLLHFPEQRDCSWQTNCPKGWWEGGGAIVPIHTGQHRSGIAGVKSPSTPRSPGKYWAPRSLLSSGSPPEVVHFCTRIVAKICTY